MDQDLQDHEEESTRDLRLSRWRVPTLAAVLIVNLCLVALAVGRPVGPSEHRVPVAVAKLPVVADAPPVVAEGPAPVELVPIERVVIAPDIDLVLPPEPAPVEQPQPEPPAPLPVESEPAETTPVEAAPVEPAPVEPAPTEPMPIEPTPAEPPLLPRNELPSLVIVNPPQSGGPIHFAIDGAVCTLLPGEYHRLPGADRRRIEYHRGDDFDYAQHELAEGVHQFSVSDSGWTLVIVEREQASRLIEICRAIVK
jgi:hypothetical protein